jgi:hypothetical protein
LRERPFIPAGEQPRPFSEIAAERRQLDSALRRRDQLLADIADLEAQAAEQTDLAERNRLQCQAEELRCELYHSMRR